MAEEYTPTTLAVRHDYGSGSPRPWEARVVEFDRWLAAQKAEAWDDGADFMAAQEHILPDLDKNPYRTEAPHA